MFAERATFYARFIADVLNIIGPLSEHSNFARISEFGIRESLALLLDETVGNGRENAAGDQQVYSNLKIRI